MPIYNLQRIERSQGVLRKIELISVSIFELNVANLEFNFFFKKLFLLKNLFLLDTSAGKLYMKVESEKFTNLKLINEKI